MRYSSRPRCGLALSLFLVASLMPVRPVRAAETVALTFGWPSGLHGLVTFSARTTRTVNGRSDSLDMTARYHFTTSAVGDGLLIQFDDVETEVENAGSGPQAMVKAYLARAVSMPPSYVVSPDGEFLRVEGLDAFRDGIFAGLEDAFADVPAAAREQVIRSMETLLTREQIEASLASDWDSHVGTWTGAEMDAGDLYELTFNRAIPAFGNMEVPMRSTFLLKGRVSCNGADTAKRCVGLEARTYVDPATLATAVEAFLARLPAGQEAPRIQEMQQETVVRLISEPDTLLPHLLESTTRTITMMSIGGETRVSSQIEEKRFVYTY